MSNQTSHVREVCHFDVGSFDGKPTRFDSALVRCETTQMQKIMWWPVNTAVRFLQISEIDNIGCLIQDGFLFTVL